MSNIPSDALQMHANPSTSRLNIGMAYCIIFSRYTCQTFIYTRIRGNLSCTSSLACFFNVWNAPLLIRGHQDSNRMQGEGRTSLNTTSFILTMLIASLSGRLPLNALFYVIPSISMPILCPKGCINPIDASDSRFLQPSLVHED